MLYYRKILALTINQVNLHTDDTNPAEHDGVPPDTLLGNRTIFDENDNDGYYSTGGVEIPAGGITSIAFTTPEVNPTLNVVENFKKHGEGNLPGSGADWIDSMRSKNAMLEYTGPLWNGTVPSHVELQTAKYSWDYNGGLNNPYDIDANGTDYGPISTTYKPAEERWSSRGTNKMPVPMNGKVHAYRIILDKEWIKTKQRMTFVNSPAGRINVGPNTEQPNLSCITWFSATPGGEPQNDLEKNGIVIRLDAAKVDPQVAFGQTDDLSTLTNAKGLPIFPVITKDYYWNFAVVSQTTATDCINNGREPTSGEVLSYTNNLGTTTQYSPNGPVVPIYPTQPFYNFNEYGAGTIKYDAWLEQNNKLDKTAGLKSGSGASANRKGGLGSYFSYHGRIQSSSNMRYEPLQSFSDTYLCIWFSRVPGGAPIDAEKSFYWNTFSREASHGINKTISGDPHVLNEAYADQRGSSFLYTGSDYGVKYWNMATVDPATFFSSGFDPAQPHLGGDAWHLPGTAGFDSAVLANNRRSFFPDVTLTTYYPPSYTEGGRALTYNGGTTQAVDGGSGARLYFTSRNIPDCSEKGSAKDALGLPDMVTNPDYVNELADIFNSGLVDAGHDPDDINFSVQPINDDISTLVLDAPGYDGVELGDLGSGFLEKLGIPVGDYNHAMACMVMSNQTSVPDENPTVAQLNELSDEDGYLIPTENGLPREVISIRCVTNMDFPGRTIFGQDKPGKEGYDPDADRGDPADDSGGLLGWTGNVSADFIDNLYQYELVSPTGAQITNPQQVQNCEVLILESQRYQSPGEVQANISYKQPANISLNIADFDKIWIDSTANTLIDVTNPSAGNKTDFVTGGWTYYEKGVAKRWAKPLVDTKYVNEVMLYDQDTGEREYSLDLWDPFKGVIPAFIDAEIHYISQEDPVVYNSKRARFGKDNCGQVWWDTNGIRYDWYEQGTNSERASNWGDTFPGSVLNLLEWTESLVPPTEYRGTGTPKNAVEYITDRRKDPKSGEYTTYYYFWVMNKEELTSFAKERYLRKMSTKDLAKNLSNPIGQGLNTISFISSNEQTKANQASMMIANLPGIIREDENVLQINLSRNLNPLGLKHVAWKLLRENDIDSEIPEDLSAKLIDSLCGEDATGQVVPAENLSEVEKYGTAFRPRQTMFKDEKEARREMHYVLNEILADLKIETLNPKWANNLPSQDIAKTSNWYDVLRTSSTNEKIRYDFTYKSLFTVESVKALDTLLQSNLADGTIIMVRNSKEDRYQLWRWVSKSKEFKLIALENETAQLSKKVYGDLTSANKIELRSFLELLRDSLFEGTNLWNKFFFSMLKFAYGEQLQLDWAFKSSYIYVDKEESDLTKRVGFKPDNFESVKEYMDEAKPYSSKIREYKDGKKTPIDYISGQMVSDFDMPPYPDPVASAVRVLDITNTTDQSILTQNGDYVKFYGEIQDHSNISNAIVNQSPVRTGNIQMVFDRTDWRLLPHNFNADTHNYSQGTAEMIAYLNSDTNANISSNTNVSMSGRIFKFNPDVRTQFVKDIDSYFGEGASSNTNIIYNSTQLENAVIGGGLVRTLALVKDKVGGGFRGDELDANVFTKVVKGTDPTTLQTGFGFDSEGFDSVGFDTSIEVQNYEGVFEGNTTLRRSGVTYEGFDSVTFQKVLYGEERPEEMAMFSPLENLIVNVRTSTFAYGNGTNAPATNALALGPYEVNVQTSVGSSTTVLTNYGSLLNNGDEINISGTAYTISSVTQNYEGNVYSNTSFVINLSGHTNDPTANITYTRGPEAVDVEYLAHYDMFGGAEYVRVRTDGETSTLLSVDLEVWEDKIIVDDITKIPEPKPGTPGIIWVGKGERIEYRALNKGTRTLSDLKRGTKGTTISSHSAGTKVESGNYTEVFDDIRNVDFNKKDPDDAYWLRQDGTSTSLTDITNRSSDNLIAKFLHGDESASIGFDVRGWEIDPWDSA